MELIEGIPRAHAALAAARREEAERITTAIEESRIVGVLREAEVGKTETVRQGITPLLHSASLIHLDLDGAASEEHAAFLLVKQIARAQMGATDFSLLSADVLRPARVEAGRVALAELLGVDGLDEAMREWPSGEYPLPKALNALEALSQSRDAIIWIDHLEAPLLTPRHPLQLDRLLWGIRELLQRTPRLATVLTGRIGAEQEALGKAAAFHQQGRWLSLSRLSFARDLEKHRPAHRYGPGDSGPPRRAAGRSPRHHAPRSPAFGSRKRAQPSLWSRS